jgi:hypothetical protein
METQVIVLGGKHFCVVFEVQAGKPVIVDKYWSGERREVKEWLDAHEYPKPSEILQHRKGTDLAEGFYIKPHVTDLYFRVHENDHVEEVDSKLFDDPVGGSSGY